MHNSLPSEINTMRKTVIFFLLLLASTSNARCDVIYFPYPFTGICYSIEGIFSYERIKKPHATTTYWGGFGRVGSIYEDYDERIYGLEAAIERRYYFQANKFKHFFISAYLGTAFMTEFDNFSSIGLVPGVKVNYKANLFSNFILEPYISISVPITRELTKYPDTITFPALTFGTRIGINKLKDKSRK
jgi:hypothetical protein